MPLTNIFFLFECMVFDLKSIDYVELVKQKKGLYSDSIE